MADGTGGGWDEGPFSRRTLLEVAARCGAIYTAKLDGEELPYDGALFHAEELECDGLFERVPDSPVLPDVRDFVIWKLTERGIRVMKERAA
jgi:hypothetical protein